MSRALITGASSGLGVCFAERLAAQGRDLVLVARRRDRMEELAARLGARHGVAIDVIAADLALPGAGAMLAAELARRGIAVEILVNNAGFALHGGFATMDADAIDAMVAVNVAALTGLSRALLPPMIAAGRGAILNVASIAAFQPGPWLAVYFATKAYVLSLSEALHEEARRHGVTVTALCPGPVRTEFAAVAGMGDNDLFTRFAADPDDVARAGLKALARGRAVRVHGPSRLLPPLLRLIPRARVRRMTGAMQRGRA